MATKTNSMGAMLEQMELIAVDTRKQFYYDKASGLWSWYNRDENTPDGYHNGFATRFKALMDAVEPYMDGGSDV